MRNFILRSGLILTIILKSGLGQAQVDCTSHGAIMGFADHLYNQGEYYRAITEYQRYCFLCENAETCELAQFRIGMAYYHGERYQDAFDEMSSFQKHYPESHLLPSSFFLSGRAALQLNDFSMGRNYFCRVLQTDSSLASRAQVQIVWSLLLERNWEKARKMVKPDPPYDPLWIPAFYDDLGSSRAIPHKDPILAAVLSAGLPGSGHAYCRRYRDMITAFLVNSVLIWGALTAFDHEEQSLGLTLSCVELFFYSGTILSSYSSVRKFNREQEKRWLDRMRENYFLDDISELPPP
ncbi:hypothetical protein JXQ70_05110 [bacterium]|nr:hypothetical protein [bacterium]